MAHRVPFDERGNPEITIDDLSPVLVMDYLRRVRSRLKVDLKQHTMEELADHLDLYTGATERRMLKNVAAMMFCDENAKFFPYTQVEIVVFHEGRIENPHNFLEIEPIKGNIPQVIRDTLNYFRTIVIKERVIKPKDRAESVRFFNYPYQAIEEAVVNALYHRDYQVREPVEIVIEPHEITILSYAGPDRSISREAIASAQLFRARRYRNRRLGDFLKELDFTEGRSSGIPTIQDELRKNGSPAATVETDDDRSYFLITLPVHPDFKGEPIIVQEEQIKDPINPFENNGYNSDTKENTFSPSISDDLINDPISNKVSEKKDEQKGNAADYRVLSSSEKKVVFHIASTQEHTYQSIARTIGISETTVKRIIKQLTLCGILRRIGSKKNGRWVVPLEFSLKDLMLTSSQKE